MDWRHKSIDESTWNETSVGQLNPQKQLIWVRAKVKRMSNIDKQQPYGVFITGAASSEFWWNGEFIGRNGVPGASKNDETPGMMSASVYLPLHLIQENNVLAMRMSSFHQPHELLSPIQFVRVGEYQDPRLQYIDHYAVAFMAAGVLLIGGVYFLVLFFFKRSRKDNLLLSLLAFAVLFQLCAETSRAFISYGYQYHVLRLNLILFSALVSGVLLISYIALKHPAKYRKIFLAIASVVILLSAVGAPGYDLKTVTVLLVSMVCAMILAAFDGFETKNQKSISVLLAMLFLLALFIYDPRNFIDSYYYIGAVALMLVLFVQQVITLRQAEIERSDAQVRSTRLELELLKKQLQPHFLLNTLTALSEWVETEPKKGVEMIDALSQEFRLLQANSSAKLIPLKTELELCRQHLQVMSLRRDVQLKIKEHCDDGSILIPPGVIHTLLENALSHNNYQSNADFQLSVKTLSDGAVELKLQSPRTGQPVKKESGGLGHNYIKSRLKESFADRWEFKSGPESDQFWVDKIILLNHRGKK